MSGSPVEAEAGVERRARGNGVQLLAVRLTRERPGSEWWLGAGIAIALMAATWLIATIAGPVSEPRASFEARLPYALSAVLGLVFAVFPYGIRRAQGDLDELRPSLHCSETEFRELRQGLAAHSRRVLFVAGCGVVVLFLLVQEIAVGRLTRFFVTGDWNLIDVWATVVGACFWWTGLRISTATFLNVMIFRRVSNTLLEVDLFEPRLGNAVARFGLRTIFLAIVLPAVFFAIGLAGGALLPSVGAPAFLVNVVLGLLALALPTSGLRRRIREAKLCELERVDRAVRGDRGALAESRVASEAGELKLVELLQYRREVEAVREWPYDASSLARFLFYVLLPPASWLAAAMVERGLDRLLDR